MQINAKDYSPELAKRLIPAMGDYSVDILDEIKHGQAHIWEIGECLFVVRFEQSRSGVKEMVVVAAVGQELKSAAHRITEQAYYTGCHSVRFHTQSPALHKLLGLPFNECERVYRMNVEAAYGPK